MKPTLLVLAAGMGSRYGGLKQLDGIGPHGETIMDYSIYDAMQAGFGKVVFVIRRDFESDFREKIASKYTDRIPVEIVFQSTDDLPSGFTCPPERSKPWGTNHAILAARDAIHEPFAVINADDFYGRQAYEAIYEEMQNMADTKGKYCMVGFRVANTMSENGSVSRGVCTANVDGLLNKVVERTEIAYDEAGNIKFIDEYGVSRTLDPKTPVSMNLWGFTPDYFEYSMNEFVRFLNKYINKEKSEFFIPSVVDKLIQTHRAEVKLLDTESRWFGVTYPEDRANVVEKLAQLHNEGVYPETLF